MSYRRAIRQSATRSMQTGIQGIKIICSGRLGGAEIARNEKHRDGRVPLHTLGPTSITASPRRSLPWVS